VSDDAGRGSASDGAARSSPRPLLSLRDIRGGYGEDVADILNGVDLDVHPREIVTVAGTNGAGKSTLVRATLGLLPKCSGAVRFDGSDLARLSTEDRIDAGIGYVPQVDNVFRSLSVRENLEVVARVADRRRRIDELFAMFPSLAERRSMRAGALSGGERQQLAFARALMPDPRLLLCDEPTAALSPVLARQVLGTLRALVDHDVAVLLVEQNVRAALAISDRGYVLDGGRVVASGEAAALAGDAGLAALYLGDTASARA
jgi:branched-chain amino acid transport system ATP-binding protein